MNLAAVLAFARAVVAPGGCIVCLWRGELPPLWLALVTLDAVLTVVGLALITVRRQS